jgi:amidase
MQYEQLVAALFDSQRLDALLAPANARAWRTDWQAGDRFTVGSSSLAATVGYPSVAVPTALVDELPLGVVLVARPNQERLLLDLASALEQRRGGFPLPRFLSEVLD